MNSIKSLPLLLMSALPVFAGTAKTADPATRPQIQVALLLDTSNSMDGLIDQAKRQLWHFVGDFAAARRAGLRPELRVALYEYGKSSLPQGENYLRMIVPFTGDLDRVSEALFALTTNGGDEYCGAVIKAAVGGLDWSSRPGDLKVIFIAGNEPFTQGDVDYREADAAAKARGIVVNTIFCGGREEGVSTNWQDGAARAGGFFMNIDQNRQVAQVTAPQDAEILDLNGKLNTTYVPVGVRGREGKARQEAQDHAASGAGAPVAAARVAAKASGLYEQGEWDAVDGVQAGRLDLGKLKDDELPQEMRGMTVEQRKAYVETQAKKRAELQARIRKLQAEREKFLAEAEKKAAGAPDTLDQALSKSLRTQAEAAGYSFEAK